MAIRAVLLVLVSLLLLVRAALAWIYRVILGVLISLVGVGRSVFTVRWATFFAIAVLLFAGGLFVKEFQEEIMSDGVDVVYECGVFRAAQIGASALHWLLRIPYEFIATEWNDLIVFVVDTIDQLIMDLQMMIKVGRLASRTQIYDALKREVLPTIFEIGELVRDFFRIIRDSFVAVGNFISCVLDYFMRFWTAVITTRTLWNQDCTNCALDPPIDESDQSLGTDLSCAIREPFVNGANPDCFECHDFVAIALGCVGDLLADIIPPDLIVIDLGRVARALACIINSAVKPAIFIFQGIIDFFASSPDGNCVDITDPEILGDFIIAWFTSTECGKPSGCDLPPSGTDLPIGIIPCWNEFIQAITDDEVAEFFELIFAFVFSFIAEVIQSIEGIVDCFDQSAYIVCLGNFPADGMPGVTPGVCDFADPPFTLPDDLVPTGGMADCWRIVGQCLDNPENISLLVPLVESGLIDFLFDDFWKFTIDFTVCPFVGVAICFDDPPDPGTPECLPAGGFSPPLEFMNDIICPLNCTAVNIPVLSDVAIFLADAFLEVGLFIAEIVAIGLEIIEAVTQVFECIFRCFETGTEGIEEFFECFDIDNSGEEGWGCEGSRRRFSEEVHTPEQAQAAFERWTDFLHENNIYDDTTCGNILHAYLPSTIEEASYGDRSVYYGCLSMLSALRPWKKRCDPALVDIGGLMGVNTFLPCWDSLKVCFNDYYQDTSHLRTSSRPGALSAEDLSRLTEADVNASQALVMARDFSSFVTRTRPKVREGLRSWNFYYNFTAPMWQRFRGSTFYTLCIDFGTRWRNISHTVHVDPAYGNASAALTTWPVDSQSLEAEREALYMDFVNAILWNYRTRMSPAARRERRALRAVYFAGGRRAPASRGVALMHQQQDAPLTIADYRTAITNTPHSVYKPLTMSDLRHKQQAFTTAVARINTTHVMLAEDSGTLMEIWLVINARYNLDAWPSVQRAGAVLHVARSRDFAGFHQWTAGRKQFLVGTGFVEEAEYERELSRRETNHPGSLLDLATGNYSVRAPKKYRPFPLNTELVLSDKMNLNWVENASEAYAESHRRHQMVREARRDDLGFGRVMRGQGAQEIKDVNEFIYDVIDWILNDVITELLNAFSNIGIGDFVGEDLTEFLEDYFTCSIPENIDGTELFSPWCFLLLPENLFSLLEQLPTNLFPVQIGWPEELVKQDCVNEFNGNQELFDLELSNNCPNADGQPRPFCPTCDHCDREYRACSTASCLLGGENGTYVDADALCDLLNGVQTGDGLCVVPPDNQTLNLEEQCEALDGEFQSGFGDVLDTLLYILGVLPIVIEAYSGGNGSGIATTTLEAYINLLFAIRYLPSIFSVVGIPIYGFLVGTVIHLLTWTIGAFFGEGTPLGLLTLIVLSLFLYFFPPSSLFLRAVTAVFVLLSMFWLVTLFIAMFTKVPNFAEELNIIQGLIDLFTLLDETWLICAINFQPLINRLERFNYGTGPVPKLCTFCFFWNFSDIALLAILAAFLSPFGLRVLYRLLLATSILFLDLIIIFYELYRQLRLMILEDEEDESSEEIEKIKQRIDDLHQKLVTVSRTLPSGGGTEPEHTAITIAEAVPETASAVSTSQSSSRQISPDLQRRYDEFLDRVDGVVPITEQDTQATAARRDREFGEEEDDLMDQEMDRDDDDRDDDDRDDDRVLTLGPGTRKKWE